jgi:hypothetical protein
MTVKHQCGTVHAYTNYIFPMQDHLLKESKKWLSKCQMPLVWFPVLSKAFFFHGFIIHKLTTDKQLT